MSKTIARRIRPALSRKYQLTSAAGSEPSSVILLAEAIAEKPHTPLPRVSRVGKTGIRFTFEQAPRTRTRRNSLEGLKIVRRKGESQENNPTPGSRPDNGQGA